MTPPVPGWPRAFRGSLAVAAGLVTKDRLRGPRYRRVFPDVYVLAEDDGPDLLLRSLAAYRWIEGRGVLSGYSAARLLRADCAARGAPAEVTVPGERPRVPDGVVVHRGRLAPGEIVTVDGVRCTSPLRTAYDLGRQQDPVEAVVALDRLPNRYRFNPDLLVHFAARYRGARGTDRLLNILGDACPYACSPMETRLRLLLVGAGLPPPRVQWVVQDERARTAVWLDLAYPRYRVGVSCDGREHTDPERVLRDIGRGTRLVDKGWRIYRYTRNEVRTDRARIVQEVRRALEVDTSGVLTAADPADVYLGRW